MKKGLENQISRPFPFFLPVCSGIGSIHRSSLLSVCQIPSGVEDQLSSFGHQRKLDLVYSVCHLMVVVMHPVEEEDYRNIELRKVVMV